MRGQMNNRNQELLEDIKKSEAENQRELNLTPSFPFNELPAEIQNEIISKLSLRNRIAFFKTSKTPGQFVKNPSFWPNKKDAENYDDFMTRTKALPLNHQRSVLNEEMPLKTAEMLKLTPDKRMGLILSSLSKDEAEKLNTLTTQNNYLGDPTKLFEDDISSILLYEKLLSANELEIVYNVNGKGGKTFGALFENPIGFKALRAGLIKYTDCLSMKPHDIRGLLANNCSLLKLLEQFIGNLDAQYPEDFKIRFFALSKHYQAYVAANIISISSAEMLQQTPKERAKFIMSEKVCDLLDQLDISEENLIECMKIDFSALLLHENILTLSQLINIEYGAFLTLSKTMYLSGYRAIRDGVISIEKLNSISLEELETVLNSQDKNDNADEKKNLPRMK